jgi:hypothetical protein
MSYISGLVPWIRRADQRSQVPLFIDRYPFERWTDATRTPPVEQWVAVVPVLITEPGSPAPSGGAVPQHWLLHTGSRGESFAWRHHLVVGGLDPDYGRLPRTVTITTVVGARQTVPCREADLWLVSNIPALASQPWRLELLQGIPFLDVATIPDPHFHRPLMGMRALRRARLRVELDFDGAAVSVWTPDPPAVP